MKTNETKTKVMLSQPMNGIPDSEVRRIQKELKENLCEEYGIMMLDNSFFNERRK